MGADQIKELEARVAELENTLSLIFQETFTTGSGLVEASEALRRVRCWVALSMREIPSKLDSKPKRLWGVAHRMLRELGVFSVERHQKLIRMLVTLAADGAIEVKVNLPEPVVDVGGKDEHG